MPWWPSTTPNSPRDVRQFLIERDFAMVVRILPLLIGTNHPPMTFRLELVGLTLPVDGVEIQNVALAVETATATPCSSPRS